VRSLVERLAFESRSARMLRNFSSWRALRPSAFAAATRGPRPPGTRREHLAAAIAWLARAQDVSGGGVSAAYSLRRGWYPPYPETTGYIVCTFYDLANATGGAAEAERATRMARWLVSIQRPDGSFPGGFGTDPERPPVVFDVGQILQGLVRAHRETRDAAFLEAARRAGDWLVRAQDDDGAWRRHEYHDIPHVYETRTAWALAALSQTTQTRDYADAARRHAAWALARQRPSGWFSEAAFRTGDTPLTHTLAYTLEGLHETGVVLKDSILAESARRGADALLARYLAAPRWNRAPPGLVPGRLDEAWQSGDRWSCLTGSAQIALLWLRIAEEDGLPGRYLAGASRLLDAVLAVHDTTSSDEGVRGGLAGAYPHWGSYQSYAYPNWAAKFLADALLAESRVLARA